MPCRAATIIGCWLSAIRSTVNAQKRCSMYKLPTTDAMAANPRANSANTASSSHTKYICSKTNVARNIHIHFRLLSLVFIFPCPPSPVPLNPDRQSAFRFLNVLSAYLLLGCATLSRRSVKSLDLSHLTPFASRRRWYASHIFGFKLVT